MSRCGRLLRCAIALWCLWVALPAPAHEARPAYLEITESSAGRYDLLWRTPLLAGQPLPVALALPEGFRLVVAPAERVLQDSVVERLVVDAGPGGLAGQRIDFQGLHLTITDVLVRVSLRDGTHWTALVKPAQPWIELRERQGAFAIAGAYVLQGVHHILLGYDHLLFVFALLWIVRRARTLVLTITAFTVAHSITLALATLGVVHVPAPPVEATIALSIVLLASEIARMGQGRPSLTSRYPWAVASAFGLLHGFGFAGALSEIGLPQGDVALALLSFNVGVELGQLAFVALVLAVRFALTRVSIPAGWRRHAPAVACHAIGTLATFWFAERLSGFWA